MKEKAWNRIVIAGTVGILAVIAVITIIIDPFFHYHKPLESLEYPMLYERYQNDGTSDTKTDTKVSFAGVSQDKLRKKMEISKAEL